eukprot:3753071-Rhodomonas_salina.2
MRERSELLLGLVTSHPTQVTSQQRAVTSQDSVVTLHRPDKSRYRQTSITSQAQSVTSQASQGSVVTSHLQSRSRHRSESSLSSQRGHVTDQRGHVTGQSGHVTPGSDANLDGHIPAHLRDLLILLDLLCQHFRYAPVLVDLFCEQVQMLIQLDSLASRTHTRCDVICQGMTAHRGSFAHCTAGYCLGSCMVCFGLGLLRGRSEASMNKRSLHALCPHRESHAS